MFTRRKKTAAEAAGTRKEGGGKRKNNRRGKLFPLYETHFIGDGSVQVRRDYSLCIQYIKYI